VGQVQVWLPSGLRRTVQLPSCLRRWWCRHRQCRLSAVVLPPAANASWWSTATGRPGSRPAGRPRSRSRRPGSRPGRPHFRPVGNPRSRGTGRPGSRPAGRPRSAHAVAGPSPTRPTKQSRVEPIRLNRSVDRRAVIRADPGRAPGGSPRTPYRIRNRRGLPLHSCIGPRATPP
jgi:hypothetical protein